MPTTWLDNLAWDPPISRRQLWERIGKQSNRRPSPPLVKEYKARWLSKERWRAAPLSGTSRSFVYAWLTAGMLAQPAGCSLFGIKMTSESESVKVTAVSHWLSLSAVANDRHSDSP
jgi:hypothetical protein